MSIEVFITFDGLYLHVKVCQRFYITLPYTKVTPLLFILGT